MISMNMSTLVVAFGAWAFSRYEGWSYLDSVYYCVITLTTVGFGDFVALQNPHKRQIDYFAFSMFFIVVGLAVVSSAMNLLILRFLTMNTADERRDESLASYYYHQYHYYYYCCCCCCCCYYDKGAMRALPPSDVQSSSWTLKAACCRSTEPPL